MWNRNVYNKLYLNDNRCLTDNDIIPLSADELAVNIRNIRLYEAKIFHKERKEAYTGYIGQSKIGKRKAGFARTKQAAIDLAIREVTKDLDAQLKGETE
jgi:YesN/AraC family two-component response regulator